MLKDSLHIKSAKKKFDDKIEVSSFYIFFVTNNTMSGLLNSFLIHGKVMDASGKNSLAMIPAKFLKTLWIKRGLYCKRTYLICLE